MKKFLFAVAIVAVMASCSNDSEQSTTMVNETDSINFSTKSSLDLKTLHQMMISSQSYINYKAAHDAFVDKMNFKGDRADIESEAKIKDWIYNNIGLTDFPDFTTAIDEYDELKSLGLISLNDNKLFYETIQIEGTSGLFDLMYEQTPLSNDCPSICGASLNSCRDWVSSWYHYAVAEATAQWVSPSIESTNNFNNQMIAIEIGADLYNEECDNEYVDCCAA
ncbi:hypothetical protein E0W68_08290 [Flavobacterium salilacus subsp. salilacus]|uniref:hypothetical protein n=1 Tax=Flavobacterium TaxID=237 RepID=UPI001074E8BF|nr:MULTISPECIES: hypothetical protein [Flavobacterium]KAF2518741.1 hypothetical protein E0W68_08290 [Flavobacterium salilacus subsp. salilacus]MBE1613707.1 hypothetical protein [Flavobacterium sp. SaA2.13]